MTAGSAALGGLTAAGIVYGGLGTSTISYCRIPIASVFAPIFVDGAVDVVQNNSNMIVPNSKNSNSKACCSPKLSLKALEAKYPVLEGISYGFYVMFATLFGVVVSNSIALTC
jgi:hypothetical protein